MYKFDELIRNGCFGPLRLGSDFRDASEILGEPQGVSTFKRKRPLICKYGILEVTFDWADSNRTNRTLDCFTVYFDQTRWHYVPSIFGEFDWFPNEKTESGEIERYLKENDISWIIEENELLKYTTIFRKKDGSWDNCEKDIINYFAGVAEFSFVENRLISMYVAAFNRQRAAILHDR